MRTIKIKRNGWIGEDRNNLLKIQEALIDKGFYASEEQCIELWEKYWMYDWQNNYKSPQETSKEEIYNMLKEFFEPGPESSIDSRYI